MNYLKFNIIGIAFLLVITSCTSSRKIQNSLNEESYSLAYLKDSEIADHKYDQTLVIDSVIYNPDLMNDSTEVIKQKGMFIPLVLIYIWNSEHHCIQGKSMFKEDLSHFLYEGVTEEAKRSGNFHIRSGDKEASYKLELSIDEINTEGPYYSNGFFYFALYVYGYSYSDNAGPALSKLKVSYKLKKDSKIVHENSFNAEMLTDPIQYQYGNIKLLQKDYAVSMVEATSKNFKFIIEQIINDLNNYIEYNETKDNEDRIINLISEYKL